MSQERGELQSENSNFFAIGGIVFPKTRLLDGISLDGRSLQIVRKRLVATMDG